MNANERQYYILSDELRVTPGHEVERHRFRLVDDPECRWNTGLAVPEGKKPVEPIRIETRPTDDEEEEGETADPVERWIYPEFSREPIPLFSRRLVDLFRKAGVDNLQIFETELVNPRGDRPAKNNYLAVNIIGLIDPSQLDPTKVIFRLKDARDFIIVNRTLKTQVEESGLKDLSWAPVRIQPTVANPDGTFTELPLISLP